MIKTRAKIEPKLRSFVALVLVLVLVVITFSVLLSPWATVSQWQLIEKRGVINFGTRTSLLSYFKANNQIIGYEYQILKTFADANDLTIEVTTFQNNGQMFDALESGNIDIAGGHLTVTKERQKNFSFTESISQTAIDLVTHFGYRNKTKLNDYESAKGVIIDNSSYLETLIKRTDFSPRYLSTVSDVSLFELIRGINSKEFDYTFGDSEIINIYQYFIPGLYQTIQISDASDTAFMLRKNRSNEFKNNLDFFISAAKTSGLIDQLKDQILLHLPDIDTANTVTFFDKLQTNWPPIKDLVFSVAAEMSFDPALLAAISYQESHWEVDAQSFTGVKGLMMLTAMAAQDMEIADRTDPKQSLEGGVKYFRYMKSKLPARIEEPHLTLFALAAYNVGFGHLEDARILAQKAGADPDVWFEVETFLAKLNNPSIEHELKYGNADGYTAMLYVNNIMTYRQLMNWKINKELQSIENQP